MLYQAKIIAEQSVAQDYVEAAGASVVRLAEAMGFADDPQITLERIGDRMLQVNRRGQVDRTVVDALPYSDALTVVVTSKDLGAGDGEATRLSWVFGTSRLGRVVASTFRVGSSDQFAALTLHEGGHAEGLVQSSSRNYDRLTSFGGHCVNQCVMRAGDSDADLRALVRQSWSLRPFCDDCADFLSHRPRLP